MKKRWVGKLFAALMCMLMIFVMTVPEGTLAAEVKLNKTKKTICVGDTYRLKLKNSTGKVKWSSTDTTVAKVSSKGLVTAVGEGSCKIKAKNNGKNYYCKIKVKAASSQGGGFTPVAYGDTKCVDFSLKDTKGNTIDNSVFGNNYLTMINFWEPWCGPCVRELPDIEKLYKNYRDKGFNVIGIYSTVDNAAQRIKDAGLTYTLINDSSLYWQYGNGYVPYTIFVDGYGSIISSLSDAGSKDYATFETIVKQYVK